MLVELIRSGTMYLFLDFVDPDPQICIFCVFLYISGGGPHPKCLGCQLYPTPPISPPPPIPHSLLYPNIPIPPIPQGQRGGEGWGALPLVVLGI